MKYKLLYLLLIYAGMQNLLHAQITKPTDYDCFLNNGEKTFVHFHKLTYVSGEKLYYKAFTVNASTLKPSRSSKIMYFDIKDNNNNSVLSWRVNLLNGNASGAITIPDTIKSGIYTFRAHTNWMRNSAHSNIYSANIVITDMTDRKSRVFYQYTDNQIENYDICFYPEGGKIIGGAKNNVGYKMNTKYKGRANLSVIINDNFGNLVDSFIVDKLGYGMFSFIPDVSKKYTADLYTDSLKTITVRLPSVENHGFVLRTTTETDEINIDIISINNNSNIHINKLILSLRGKIIVEKTLQFKNNKVQIKLDANSMNSGIYNLNFYNSNNKLVCYRLVYVPEINSIEVKNDLSNNLFAPSEIVKFEIELDGISENDSADLSVSVSESDSPVSKLTTIPDVKSQLFYRSDLSWCNELINSENKIDAYNINKYLLVTNQKQYAWQIINHKKTPNCLYHIESDGYILSGSVQQKDGKAIANSIVLLAYADSVANLNYAITDSIGEFYFLLDKSYDNKKLIFQLYNTNYDKSSLIWKIDNKAHPLAKNSAKKLGLTAKMNEQIMQNRKLWLIHSVYNTDSTIQTIKRTNNYSKGSSFYDNPEYIKYPSDYLDLSNFREICQNILFMVSLRKKDNKKMLKVHDKKNSVSWPLTDFVLLNSIPFVDMEHISDLGSKSIERIEVYTRQLLFGELTFSGLVSIYTPDRKIPKSYLKSVFIYDNIVDETSSYDLTIPQKYAENGNIEPDFRQNLYWNPSIILKKGQKATISFKTSELKANYKIIINGITSNGKIISSSKSFEVK